MWTVHGLKNCDTCRKALKWLEAEGIEHRFHDVRKDGLTEEMVERWAAAASVEQLVNRRGTTWRRLSDEDRAAAESGKEAIPLCAANPALIKRPVFERDTRVLVGFTDQVKADLRK